MSRSKYSPQQGKENKTVPSREEQSSQTSSWWAIALVVLCTFTTIFDKRKPHPSMAPTELQDKQTESGQIESSASGNGQGRNERNPQTWGNFSLVLIQGAMLSLFQVALFDPENYKVLIYVCLYGLLAIGVCLFFATTTLEGATMFIFSVP